MSCAILNQLAPPSRLYWIIRRSLLRQVGALPLDLLDAPHQPDFSAVRLDDVWASVGVGVGVDIAHNTSRRCSRTELAAAIRSTPDDHFTAGPDCRVMVSGRGRVGGAGGCPTIRAGIVSPAGVQIAVTSTPPQTIISLPVQTAV